MPNVSETNAMAATDISETFESELLSPNFTLRSINQYTLTMISIREFKALASITVVTGTIFSFLKHFHFSQIIYSRKLPLR